MVIGIEATHANRPERTGVEEYCFQIIQEFKKIIPPGERVILYTNEPLRGGLEVLPPNWEIRVLRWPFRKMWSQFRLAWELWRRPPDVFFAPGQLIPFFSPRCTVTTIHDCAFVAVPEAYTFFGGLYLRFMNRLIIWRSALILTSAEFNKRELVRYYARLAADRVVVIPLGFDASVRNQGIPIPLQTISVRPDMPSLATRVTKPFIMTIGRLETKKNSVALIRAFELLKKKYDIQLVLVGKPGAGYPTIDLAIQYSSYRTDIIELGYCPTPVVRALLTNAVVFAFPSLYEGFGIPILEAMAAGCPVVAASGHVLEEVGGKAVLYADPLNHEQLAQQIERVLIEPALAERLRVAGLQRVRDFSWQKTAVTTWNSIASTGRTWYTNR